MTSAPPAKSTDFQLLEALVPDINQRLDEARKNNPGLFKELLSRAVDEGRGWRPLSWWQGAF